MEMMKMLREVRAPRLGVGVGVGVGVGAVWSLGLLQHECRCRWRGVSFGAPRASVVFSGAIFVVLGWSSRVTPLSCRADLLFYSAFLCFLTVLCLSIPLALSLSVSLCPPVRSYCCIFVYCLALWAPPPPL